MANLLGRILIVESDIGLREALERLLRAAGYEAGGWSSAEELLADAGASGAACIVSDLELPAMGGLELLEALRWRGWKGSFVLMTASEATHVGKEAIRRGAAAFLVLPFPGTTLLDVVAAVNGSDRHRSPREAGALGS